MLRWQDAGCLTCRDMLFPRRLARLCWCNHVGGQYNLYSVVSSFRRSRRRLSAKGRRLVLSPGGQVADQRCCTKDPRVLKLQIERVETAAFCFFFGALFGPSVLSEMHQQSAARLLRSPEKRLQPRRKTPTKFSLVWPKSPHLLCCPRRCIRSVCRRCK